MASAPQIFRVGKQQYGVLIKQDGYIFLFFPHSEFLKIFLEMTCEILVVLDLTFQQTFKEAIKWKPIIG